MPSSTPSGRLAPTRGSLQRSMTPVAVALDGANGRLFVADFTGGAIDVYTLDGQYLERWGRDGVGGGYFDEPADVKLAPDGSVFLTGKPAGPIARAPLRRGRFSDLGVWRQRIGARTLGRATLDRLRCGRQSLRDRVQHLGIRRCPSTGLFTRWHRDRHHRRPIRKPKLQRPIPHHDRPGWRDLHRRRAEQPHLSIPKTFRSLSRVSSDSAGWATAEAGVIPPPSPLCSTPDRAVCSAGEKSSLANRTSSRAQLSVALLGSLQCILELPARPHQPGPPGIESPPANPAPKFHS